MKYKLNDEEIVNNTTDEIINIDEFVKDILQIEDKELVERLVITKDLLSKILINYKVLELQFLKRMKDKKATKYEDKDIKISISKNVDYEYDINSIEKLKKLIGKERFDKTFTKQYKVNRSELKSLDILGGEIKKIIFDMQKINEKKSSINIIKK